MDNLKKFIKEEIFFEYKPVRVDTETLQKKGLPLGKKRRSGLLLTTYMLDGFGGVETPTREKNISSATPKNPFQINYQLFGDDGYGRQAEAYYMTFLNSLPVNYLEKIYNSHLKPAIGTRKKDRFDNFWETPAEKAAKASNQKLAAHNAGAHSLAGLAGIRAKIEFQKSQQGGIKPWHYLIFFFESKYNPIKWINYLDYRIESWLIYIAQRGLNPKKQEFDPAERKYVTKIFTQYAGVLRQHAFFVLLGCYRILSFVVSTVLHSRLYHYFRAHPYLFTLSFIVFLGIGLACVFFPPAAAVFLTPKLAALLAGATPALLFVWTLCAVYVSAALAKIVSQILEVALTVVSDLWVILKDQNLFIRKHPYLSLISFAVVSTFLLLCIFFPPLSAALGIAGIIKAMSPWLIAALTFVAVDLGAIISCKLCHLHDYIKSGKWKNIFKNKEKIQRAAEKAVLAQTYRREQELKEMDEYEKAKKTAMDKSGNQEIITDKAPVVTTTHPLPAAGEVTHDFDEELREFANSFFDAAPDAEYATLDVQFNPNETLAHLIVDKATEVVDGMRSRASTLWSDSIGRARGITGTFFDLVHVGATSSASTADTSSSPVAGSSSAASADTHRGKGREDIELTNFVAAMDSLIEITSSQREQAVSSAPSPAEDVLTRLHAVFKELNIIGAAQHDEFSVITNSGILHMHQRRGSFRRNGDEGDPSSSTAPSQVPGKN